MSNRDYLNRRITPAFLVMLCCFVGFAAAGTLANHLPWLPFVPFVGFGACILYLHYGVRCPRCHGRIAMLTHLPRGGYFRLSKQVKFCPFCGLDLDTEKQDG